MKEKVTYKGARAMYLADIDDLTELEEIIIVTSEEFTKK